MLFDADDSTPNSGLSATRQAPRELGDSQKFSQIRMRISKNTESKSQPKHRELGRSLQKSPQQICSHCQSRLTQVKKALRRKNLSKCLEILENQGIEGELSLFVLSVINTGDFDKCKFAEAADLISGGEV